MNHLPEFSIEKEKGDIYLKIKVRPGASKTAIKEIMKSSEGKIFKIDVAAPPVGGRANEELIRFLAKKFDVLRNNIKIISGAGERTKLIKIIKNDR